MKQKTIYRCSNCAYESPVWEGKCNRCGEWGTMEETLLPAKAGIGPLGPSRIANRKPRRLRDVQIDQDERYKTSMEEFNRVLGGGIVKDSVTILTARPGAGKSTLLLQVVYDLAKKGQTCLYLSGEESDSQIRSRAGRVMPEVPKNIWMLSTNSMDDALEAIETTGCQVFVVDSIQTFALSAFSSRPGSPTQTVECANALVNVCKNPDKPRACLMVGHLTKSDELAGLRTLEHLVDTVVMLEGDNDDPLRMLRSTKNRFGRTGEIGLFAMEESGIKELDDASNYFVTQREKSVIGSALTVVKEGSRMITAEVESLVSRSYAPYPERIGDSLRKDQVNTLISILEERAGFKLFDRNVVLKTTGGLRLTERCSDLCVMMSILSSLLERGIDTRTVFLAEVGLTGELKNIPQLDQRLDEISRLGYTDVFIPYGAKVTGNRPGLFIHRARTVSDVVKKLFI